MASATASAMELSRAWNIAADELPRRLPRDEFEAFSREQALDAVAEGRMPELLSAARSLLGKHAAAASAKAPRGRKRQKKASSTWVSGVGYGGTASTNKQLQQGTQAAQAKQGCADKELARALDELSSVLEAMVAQSKAQRSHEWCALGGMLRLTLGELEAAAERKARATSKTSKRRRTRSSSADKRAKRAAARGNVSVAGLLRDYWRNDSLMDVAGRCDLYNALLRLVAVISARSALTYTGLVGVMFAPSEGENAVDAAAEEEEGANAPALAEEGGAGGLLSKHSRTHLFAVMRRFKDQMEVVSKHSGGAEAQAGGESWISQFCARVSKTLETLTTRLRHNAYYAGEIEAVAPVKRSARRDLLRLSVGADLSAEQLGNAYVEALKDLQFRSVALLDLAQAGQYVHHAFLDHVRQCSTSNRHRLSRIIKEMGTMATSLPLSWGSGVFIRSDESRPDMMSCMILGPEGTPYANGAFIFDIFLPANYPAGPPLVLLKTTGHGTVRFNPNLYNCGKVCLSLLGTWAGPGWDTKNSTLLQVLVSIQSLIMVEDPYFNEPGFESTMRTAQGKAASDAYNTGIRAGTMRFALLDQIKDPPYLFRDVLKIHFTLKEKEIRQQCAQWAAEEATTVAPKRPGGYPPPPKPSARKMGQLRDSIGSALDNLLRGKAPGRGEGHSVTLVDDQVESAGDLVEIDSDVHSSSKDEPVDLT